MKKSEIGVRLERVIKTMKLKQYQFAEKFGISSASLTRYKSGDRLPDPEFLIALSKEKINTNWLLTGDGSINIRPDFDGWMKEQLQKNLGKVNSKTGLIETPAIDYTRTITLPILGEISAGPRDHIYDLRNLGENIEIPRSLILGTPDKYMAFRVNGHSMEPNIMHEDLVIIKQEAIWENIDQRVCAVRCDDGATLKKVELDPEHNRIVLIPFNSDYKVQIIDEDQGVDAFLIGVLSLQLRLF